MRGGRRRASGWRRCVRPSTSCWPTASATGNVAVLYGGRSPAELLYRDELERWRGRFDVQVEVTVDRAPAGWRGRVGVVPNLISRAELRPGATRSRSSAAPR